MSSWLEIIISNVRRLRNECETCIYRESPRNKSIIIGFVNNNHLGGFFKSHRAQFSTIMLSEGMDGIETLEKIRASGSQVGRD